MTQTSLYTGDGRTPATPADIPVSRYDEMVRPGGYKPDPGLVDAVNVALLLNQPLLLTGEPGTGKTQLAASVAAELGLDPPLRFDTKSMSTARDLFYTIDNIGRFREAQSDTGDTNVLNFISFQALGLAILRAKQKQEVAELLGTRDDRDVDTLLRYGGPAGHTGPKRSVVLIDEVDKAPRDFPNDILAELEEMFFAIPELKNTKVSAGEDMRPIVILTSNSEKHLPDAFLRRTIFYDIAFPTRDRLAAILESRLGSIAKAGSPFVNSALDLFETLRNEANLTKKPATAELLGWIMYLRARFPDSADPLGDDKARAMATLGTLIKNREDQRRAVSVVKKWAGMD